MKNLRYFLLTLFALAPGLVLAQTTSDIINVVLENGDILEGRGAAFGTPFVEGEDVGPLPIIQAEPAIGCTEDGSAPLIENAEEVAGNIVLIHRGACPFVMKAEAAAAAGAAALIVANNTPDDPDAIILQGGECEPDVCSAPNVGVSYNSGQVLITEAEFGSTVTIVPVEVTAPPAEVVIDNGTVLTSLFGAGFFGSDPSFGFGEGFAFEGANGLFVGSVLIGVDGNVTTNPYDGASEFTHVSGPTALGSVPDPFDTGAEAVFTSPLGFNVTLTGYADSDAPNQDFVVFDVVVENTSGSAISDAYIGLFTDWDAGATTSVDDAAGVDAARDLVYVYDPVEETKYWGVTAISHSLSGYNTDATTADDAELFAALTTANEPGVDPAERATVVGVGPFNVDAGGTVTARFAIVAGSDLGDLEANTDAAQALVVASEQVTPLGTYVLESAYPNPFSSRTTIGFELPTAQDVTLTVYDVLGRKVATLVDGVRQAGPQTVEFDAASLPSGTYIYRLEAGSTQLMERLTVVR